MSTQAEIHDDCIARLQSVDARAAFEFLLEHARSLEGYRCFLHMQGYLRTFRYTRGREWPFGFIVNRTNLLFYFRRAGLTNPAANVATLSKRFGEVVCNQRDEIKVRLNTESDARILAELVFLGAGTQRALVPPNKLA